MKVGIRKPNLKKSLKARTTGKLKRAVKKSVNPLYGKKGVGLVTNPKKAIYNKVYNKTTIGINDIVSLPKTTDNKNKHTNLDTSNTFIFGSSALGYKVISIILRVLAILIILLSLLLMLVMFKVGIFFLIFGILLYFWGNSYKKKSQLIKKESDDETTTENM